MDKLKLFLASSITHRLKIELLIKNRVLKCPLFISNLYLSSVHLERMEVGSLFGIRFDMTIIYLKN